MREAPFPLCHFLSSPKVPEIIFQYKIHCERPQSSFWGKRERERQGGIRPAGRPAGLNQHQGRKRRAFLSSLPLSVPLFRVYGLGFEKGVPVLIASSSPGIGFWV
jgi:hypothetical protein